MFASVLSQAHIMCQASVDTNNLNYKANLKGLTQRYLLEAHKERLVLCTFTRVESSNKLCFTVVLSARLKNLNWRS